MIKITGLSDVIHIDFTTLAVKIDTKIEAGSTLGRDRAEAGKYIYHIFVTICHIFLTICLICVTICLIFVTIGLIFPTIYLIFGTICLIFVTICQKDDISACLTKRVLVLAQKNS